jgi:type I restriction enzyme, S subunit
MNEPNWTTSPLPLLLGLMKSGGTPNTSRNGFYGGNIPFVSIEDMTASTKYLFSTIKTLTREGLRNSNAWLVPEGAILYSIYATLGIPRINLVPVSTNQAILAMITRPELVDRDFLYYWLDHSRHTLVNVNSSQTTQKNLSGTIVKTFVVFHPVSVPEQSQIAEVLSTVDRAIEQTEELIVKQQRIKTGLMQDLLTRGIDEHGNLRSEETHKFKESPLGKIPKDWVCSLLSYFVPLAEYGISTSLGDFGTPVLRMNNFSEGEAEVSDLKHTELMVPEKLWLRDGDVLFNRTNSWEHVGRTGIWRCQIEKATFASYLVRLTPDPDKLLSELLNIWLNWEPTQIAMRKFATPAVQQVNINPTNLRAIYAAFPDSLNEQVEIVKIFTRIRNTIKSNVESLVKLRSLKTALMQDLLTGKVRVTPLLETKEADS